MLTNAAEQEGGRVQVAPFIAHSLTMLLLHSVHTMQQNGKCQRRSVIIMTQVLARAFSLG